LEKLEKWWAFRQRGPSIGWPIRGINTQTEFTNGKCEQNLNSWTTIKCDYNNTFL
jgi:hypothetical protein